MQVERIIGKYNSGNPGPKLIFTVGIHGNEISAVKALQDVFTALVEKQPDIKGSVIGVAGNIPALEKEVRYVDEDLNRLWGLEIDELHNPIEKKEKAEIIKVLREELTEHDGEVFFFDLHSTSAESDPFIFIGDTLRNRELASLVPVPIVLGAMEHLRGTFFDLVSKSGFPTLIFQGGRESDADTIIYHKALIWSVISNKLDLDVSDNIGEAQDAISKLQGLGLEQEFYEIAYRHEITEGKVFTMNPGYKNFQEIKKREVLGKSNDRDVQCQLNGQIFMPLYQKQGNDGFFVARKIWSFWIKLSAKLRQFTFHRRLHWLVGVYKTDAYPLTFKVDQRIAFLWATEVFHLLGYKKDDQDGPWMYMSRREDEKSPPTPAEATKRFFAFTH